MCCCHSDSHVRTQGSRKSEAGPSPAKSRAPQGDYQFHSGPVGIQSFAEVPHLPSDMENYPHLPMAEVRTTQATDYMTLLQEATA
jgi:hypothetical protein